MTNLTSVFKDSAAAKKAWLSRQKSKAAAGGAKPDAPLVAYNKDKSVSFSKEAVRQAHLGEKGLALEKAKENLTALRAKAMESGNAAHAKAYNNAKMKHLEKFVDAGGSPSEFQKKMVAHFQTLDSSKAPPKTGTVTQDGGAERHTHSNQTVDTARGEHITSLMKQGYTLHKQFASGVINLKHKTKGHAIVGNSFSNGDGKTSHFKVTHQPAEGKKVGKEEVTYKGSVAAALGFQP